MGGLARPLTHPNSGSEWFLLGLNIKRRTVALGPPRQPGDLSPGLERSLASAPEGGPNVAASSIPETSFFNREACFFKRGG